MTSSWPGRRSLLCLASASTSTLSSMLHGQSFTLTLRRIITLLALLRTLMSIAIRRTTIPDNAAPIRRRARPLFRYTISLSLLSLIELCARLDLRRSRRGALQIAMKFGIERGALFGTNSPKPSKPQPLEIMRECNDSISSPPVDVPLMIDAEIPVVPSLPPAPPAPILNVNHSSSSKKNTTTKSRILTTNTVNTLKNNTRDDNVKFNLVNRPSASQLLQAKTKLISVPRREGETVREQSVAGTGMKTYQSTVQSNGDLAGESVMNELARHMRARRQMVMPTSASLSVESTRDALNSVDQQWCEHSPLRV